MAALASGCGSQSTGAGGNDTGADTAEDGGDNGGGKTPGPGTVGSATGAELYANNPLALVSGANQGVVVVDWPRISTTPTPLI